MPEQTNGERRSLKMSHEPYIIGGKRVLTFHYELTDSKGAVLDTTTGQEPMAFLTGVGHIIPALEEHLLKMQPGQKAQVHLKATDAYGLPQEKLIISVPKEDLAHLKLELGAWLQIQSGDEVKVVRITEITNENVKLDGNHPLAGMDLDFRVELVENRSATEEELAHGHAHGPHGHHHH